ncbi:MAG: hypothetical protein HY549_04875 [Elusimicrobia bacterium]|nr:hypothetical protein [Elusimicrobiota bacterium]
MPADFEASRRRHNGDSRAEIERVYGVFLFELAEQEIKAGRGAEPARWCPSDPVPCQTAFARAYNNFLPAHYLRMMEMNGGQLDAQKAMGFCAHLEKSLCQRAMSAASLSYKKVSEDPMKSSPAAQTLNEAAPKAAVPGQDPCAAMCKAFDICLKELKEVGQIRDSRKMCLDSIRPHYYGIGSRKNPNCKC